MNDGSASDQEVSKSSAAQARPTIKVECSSPEDLEAAEACIRTLYLQRSPLEGVPTTLDPGESISFLIKVAQWGHFWQAECIARHCCAGLALLTKAEGFKARHVNTLLEELPSYLKSSEAREDVVANACSQWLLKTFKDVHEVVTDNEERRIFCELCPDAVKLWAKKDDLCGCENDVATALGCWSSGKQGASGRGDAGHVAAEDGRRRVRASRGMASSSPPDPH
ncbi:hypothetical protein DUNSADRAFT_15671 [Dunaliella salina]|uniref:Uncharacterized protein n=1 Tax=Dunaliella salina TaxID=3046 RepID=A0ABQ7G502_DUNSA|nr:hypothetical protein DUNSADRAFT_15671 [Dunaliella salina]KAF5829672.1 hypothetical protein DUNSADRAFT_15671 [Dunaliella salina]|eukprot:KAF5829671.1 hypothetical protein DUNSADRAFT_15671 [Dunaliella salina]